MAFSFARIGAALGMKVEDVYVQQRRLWVLLRHDPSAGRNGGDRNQDRQSHFSRHGHHRLSEEWRPARSRPTIRRIIPNPLALSGDGHEIHSDRRLRCPDLWADAKLKACVDRDSSNMHIMACNSVAQIFADARLNSVYQAWTEVLKHPKPDEANDDAEILKRLVAAERAWIDFRDKDCSLQSTSMRGGAGESHYCTIAVIQTPTHPVTVPNSFSSNAAFVQWVQNNPAVGWRNISYAPNNQTQTVRTYGFASINPTATYFHFRVQGRGFSTGTPVNAQCSDQTCPINQNMTLPAPDGQGNQITGFDTGVPANFTGTLVVTLTSPGGPFRPMRHSL